MKTNWRYLTAFVATFILFSPLIDNLPAAESLLVDFTPFPPSNISNYTVTIHGGYFLVNSSFTNLSFETREVYSGSIPNQLLLNYGISSTISESYPKDFILLVLLHSLFLCLFTGVFEEVAGIPSRGVPLLYSPPNRWKILASLLAGAYLVRPLKVLSFNVKSIALLPTLIAAHMLFFVPTRALSTGSKPWLPMGAMDALFVLSYQKVIEGGIVDLLLWLSISYILLFFFRLPEIYKEVMSLAKGSAKENLKDFTLLIVLWSLPYLLSIAIETAVVTSTGNWVNL